MQCNSEGNVVMENNINVCNVSSNERKQSKKQENEERSD